MLLPLGSGHLNAVAHCRDGSRFHVADSSWIEWCVWVRGSYEPEVAAFLRQHATGTVIDGGANIGAISIPIARVARNVIAVEPFDEARERLQENVKLNGLENVTVVPGALADREGTAPLYVISGDDENRGASSLFAQPQLSPNGVEVHTLTIDSLAVDRTVSAIKLDVEGSELAALRGAEVTIARDHPAVVFEFAAHSQEAASASFSGFRAFFENHDYGALDRIGPQTWCAI